MAIAPGTPRFIAAMVTAQVLTQIGAFTLPALLPVYIDRLVAVAARRRAG